MPPASASRRPPGWRPGSPSPTTAAELAAAPIDDLLDRIDLVGRTAAAAPAVAVAALGGAERPKLRLSGLFAAFERLAADRLIGKSGDQLRKWANPRKRAVANLIDVIGNKSIADIDRDDALNFRSWWIDRVRDEGYDQGSANKDLGYVANMMTTLDDTWRLKLSLPFTGIRVAGERHNPRIAYDPDFVRQRILPGTELAALNDEARAATQLVALTGMRPSEIVALTPARIVLTGSIPHLKVRPEDRQLKTESSARDIPLVGQALDVIRPFAATGFPRYRASPDALSAAVNKALAAAGLRPSPGHTLYSLRHTFKDRLIAIEAPHRIQDMLMGHAPREIAYGAGPTLEHRAQWLSRVWA